MTQPSSHEYRRDLGSFADSDLGLQHSSSVKWILQAELLRGIVKRNDEEKSLSIEISTSQGLNKCLVLEVVIRLEFGYSSIISDYLSCFLSFDVVNGLENLEVCSN